MEPWSPIPSISSPKVPLATCPGKALTGTSSQASPTPRVRSFCLVTNDTECNTLNKGDCVKDAMAYRIRLHGPTKGYLHVEYPYISIFIVSSFTYASEVYVVGNGTEPYVCILHQEDTLINVGDGLALEFHYPPLIDPTQDFVLEPVS